MEFNFIGVFAAVNFHRSLDKNTFMIMNSDNMIEEGRQWLSFCNKDGDVSFSDPLGLELFINTKVCSQPVFVNYGILELMNHQLKNPTSNICGLYPNFFALYVSGAFYPVITSVDINQLLRFVRVLI